MPSRRTPPRCICGACYDEFRTGLTFGAVRQLMHQGGPPPWRQKRRSSVLGMWRELKLKFWDMAHGACEQAMAA